MGRRAKMMDCPSGLSAMKKPWDLATLATEKPNPNRQRGDSSGDLETLVAMAETPRKNPIEEKPWLKPTTSGILATTETTKPINSDQMAKLLVTGIEPNRPT